MKYPRLSSPILPGSTIGVLGSGQLGRMFTIAARRMGYRVHTLSPDEDTPTGQVADVEIMASYDDLDAVRDFSKNVAAVTFEFENVPANTVAAAADFAPVRPGGEVLHIAQHRLREKTFLSEAGLPVTPNRRVRLRRKGPIYDPDRRATCGGMAIHRRTGGSSRSLHRIRSRSVAGGRAV
jgi:5-(carboxyamino)imidazole ribonucleotide synthase